MKALSFICWMNECVNNAAAHVKSEAVIEPQWEHSPMWLKWFGTIDPHVTISICILILGTMLWVSALSETLGWMQKPLKQRGTCWKLPELKGRLWNLAQRNSNDQGRYGSRNWSQQLASLRHCCWHCGHNWNPMPVLTHLGEEVSLTPGRVLWLSVTMSNFAYHRGRFRSFSWLWHQGQELSLPGWKSQASWAFHLHAIRGFSLC
jgi:hypothetical protein